MAVIAATMLWILLAGTAFEHGENNRFRMVIEPLMWISLGVLANDVITRVHTARQRARHRSAVARTPGARLTSGLPAPSSSVPRRLRSRVPATALAQGLTALWLVSSVAYMVHRARIRDINLYLLQAQAFLDGTPEVPSAVQDAAEFGELIFVSFPPFPAVLLLPLVLVALGVRPPPSALWTGAIAYSIGLNYLLVSSPARCPGWSAC